MDKRRFCVFFIFRMQAICDLDVLMISGKKKNLKMKKSKLVSAVDLM